MFAKFQYSATYGQKKAHYLQNVVFSSDIKKEAI